jgi:hypothetical protein
MKNQRLKQFAAGFLVVLSLFVSSVAACGCSHHQEKAETAQPSCHQHSAENQSGEMNPSPENSATFDANDNCVCAQSAPRVFAKSEIVKIEKQAAAISPRITVSVALTASISAVVTSYYSKPLYLSDSFYNIKSPRAPPIL